MKNIENKFNLNMEQIISTNNMTLKKYLKGDFKKSFKSIFKTCIVIWLVVLLIYLTAILVTAFFIAVPTIPIAVPFMCVLYPFLNVYLVSIIDIIYEAIKIKINKRKNRKNMINLLRTLKRSNINVKEEDISKSKIETVEDITYNSNKEKDISPRRRVTSVIKINKKDKLNIIKQITTIYKDFSKTDLYIMNKDDIKSLDTNIIKRLVYRN